jgi:peptide/nickel transport system ATP-binding protein
MTAAALDKPILRAVELTKVYQVGRFVLKKHRRQLVAVNQVTLDVLPGETLGLVGESGCGKSTLGRCLLRLYDITSGRLEFEGRDLTHASQRELRPVRRDMQMVFQDPYASLNPRRRVADLIAEPLRVHGNAGRSEVADRVAELLRLVELRPEHASRFPHEFSGGQRQRIGIARALALHPKLIIADEPVSALDVSVQAQIINLFADLRDRLGLTYVFIAHDLAVVRQISTRVAVMYLGNIVEVGETDEIFANPRHHYTAALLASIPVPEVRRGKRTPARIAGDLPSPLDPPSGCPFRTRCPRADDLCRDVRPPLAPHAPGHLAACHHPVQ